ncbi:conserved hypothetical protein [uncultured Mycobacterium sp.]|uniref:Uncharacterized protein n=1 Tax=uncultured Mycobacterium sp. TaxID=171292 RepID=A0A1Y5NVM8_9MYCO|nr:conserved hypothetical protein [uncultured Mycobacterium sp.]
MGRAVLTMTNDSAGEVRSAAQAGRVLSPIEVGVIGVAATRTQPCPAWTAMEDYAALISERTALRAVRLPLPAGDARTVADRIISLCSPASAMFIVGLGPSDSATVQRRVAGHGGGPLVITELDVVTAALAAAATATLRGHGSAPRPGQIVVTDTESAPQLGPIVLAAWGRSVTSWHERDAAAYPLCRVVSRNDVLIDLAGTAAPNIAPGRTLTLPAAPFDYGALVLPGLLSALCEQREAVLTLDILACCARALALLTPADRILPDLNQRLLIPAVGRHVARTLSERTQRGSHAQH